jgi:hypothetical protein
MVLLRLLLRRVAANWAAIGFIIGAAVGCFGTALMLH